MNHYVPETITFENQLQSRRGEAPVVEGHVMPSGGERDCQDDGPPAAKNSIGLSKEQISVGNMFEGLCREDHVDRFARDRPNVAAEVISVGVLISEFVIGFGNVDGPVCRQRRQETSVRLGPSPDIQNDPLGQSQWCFQIAPCRRSLQIDQAPTECYEPSSPA